MMKQGRGRPSRHAWWLWVLFSFALTACAPTPLERRASNLWRDGSTDLLPPISPPPVNPVEVSDPVEKRPTDCAVWIHPTDLDRSMIMGIDEDPSGGGLYVFGLDGKLRQQISNIRFPKDVDVKNGFQFGSRRIDIVCVLERSTRKLRFFGINPKNGKLWDITGKTAVFEGVSGAPGIPLACALFRRADGAMFVFVSRKVNDAGGVLWQYRLKFNSGRIDLEYQRDVGEFSNDGLVEQIMVDDLNSYVYFYDRMAGIRKYSADPDRNDPDRELTAFGASGWESTPVGLKIFPNVEKPGTGLIVALDGNGERARARLFKREGERLSPNDHTSELGILTFHPKRPGGVEACSQMLNKKFPEGFLVISDLDNKRFEIYSWREAKLQSQEHEKRLKREKIRELNRD